MISFDAQNEFILDHEQHWVAWLEQVIRAEGFSLGSLEYVFCDDDFLLNATCFWRVDGMVRGSYTPAPQFVVHALP